MNRLLVYALGAMASFGALHTGALAADSSRYDASIERLSAQHGVPERLIRRVIMRESKYAPHVTNRGHYGLMQIKLQTAKGMGYGGGAAGLLDGETNLKYAVPYLANAYVCAGRSEDRAVALYAGGYYYVCKSKGLIGKLRTAHSGAAAPEPAVAYAAPAPQPQTASPFGFLFGQAPAQQVAAAEPQAGDAAAASDSEEAAPDFANAPLPPRRPRKL